MPPTPSNIQNPPFRIRRAFTLIELLVVIGIVVILTAITLPAVKALTKGNSQKEAVNLLNALLANARATALTTHTPTGLLIYEDTSAKGQSSAQLVTVSSTTTDTTNGAITTNFIRVPGTVGQALPSGIKIGTIANSSSTFFNTGDASTIHGRIVLFNEFGQVVQQTNLQTDPALLASDTSTTAWNLANDYSAPGFIVYDGNDLKAALANGKIASNSAANLFPWLEQNADILILNPYTGTVIR